MTATWRHLPAPARPVAAGLQAAVAAARRRDETALAQAADHLAGLDQAQVGLVGGTSVRLLLEDAHPDGLDGAAVREVLERCVRSAATWQPEVDPHVVLILLAGALGVHDDDPGPPPKPDVLARHLSLLMADLIGVGPRAGSTGPDGDSAPDDGRVVALLTRAMGEIERTQLND